jgi:pseudaminic acid cytidylyltransferase
MNVAVIPARGGSKRIPRKNIKLFCGKPMIVWSIEAARKSSCFERIIVSTDDAEIADIAKAHGAEVPFVRPAELSGDFAGTTAVMRHAVGWLRQHDLNPEYACCLYATAPFVQETDLQRGLKALKCQSCEYAFSVASFAFPIQRAIRISNDQKIEMFQPSCLTTRSQDLEEAYHDAGQFYWGIAQAWFEEKPIFDQYSTPILLPRHRVQDIDTVEDWERAEWLFKAMQAVGS